MVMNTFPCFCHEEEFSDWLPSTLCTGGRTWMDALCRVRGLSCIPDLPSVRLANLWLIVTGGLSVFV